MIAPQGDIDRIMAVMDAAFEPAYGEAWTRRQVEDALLVGNCHYLLAHASCREAGEDEKAAGFFLSRTGVEEEELLLIGVMPQYRGKGIGRFLIRRLMEDAKARGARRLLLEMRRDNPAESLYRVNGFRPIGIRANYYRHSGGHCIDAITFECALE
jgi:[ribosomal protein S18]-alanine N-acetyltransferase